MERNDRLIKKKIYRYMLTGVMTTIALQMGNVVDAMIVGNLMGSMGNAAVSASMPYIYILQAAMILLGPGGAVISAVLLGKHDALSAGKVMGFSLLLGTAYPLIFALTSFALVPQYVHITSTQGQLAQMVSDYASVYSLGMPVISLVMIFSYFMNVDNHPVYASGMNIVANAVNLLCDYVLVRYTPLAMKGAALSTIIGYLVAGLIYIPLYLKSRNRMLKPSFRDFYGSRKLILAAMKRGFPNLAYLIMTVTSMLILNRVIMLRLGAEHYSAYAVANNTQNIVQMFLNGITSVIASVAGVLYGEKDYFGMRSVLKRVLKTALTAGAAITLFFLIFPQTIAFLYGFDQAEVMPELLLGLRLFSLSFSFLILNAVSQNYYRTIGQTFLATADTAMELLVIKVPLMLLGMSFFGFAGLFGAVIFVELLSLLLLHLTRIFLQHRGRVGGKGPMAIPETNSAVLCDLSIIGSEQAAVNVSKQIRQRCREDGMQERSAIMMGLAAEEMLLNIEMHGYRADEEKNIDVCLSKTETTYVLRLRDDGIPFDPVSYVPQEHEIENIGGLEMLKKMAVRISYMRAISLNNTIIEIEKSETKGEP